MTSCFTDLLLSDRQLHLIQKNFVEELKKASRGKHTSIPYLIHTLPSLSPLKEGELFQVMTIGGSVFKSALVKKGINSTSVLEEKQDKIPCFVTKKAFFSFLEKHLNSTVSHLSLNLAYPLKPVLKGELIDGELLGGTKEHSFHGLIKKQIGKEFEQYILEKKKQTIHVTVANDTVCLFLSEISKQTWNTTVAGIIGTGSNYAFGLHNHIINLESGHFDKIIQTKSGKKVDALSLNPGEQLIEKEIAGAYLFQHFNIIAKENNILQKPLSSSIELSQIAQKNNNSPLSILAQTLLKRSASFASCQIAGIAEFLTDLSPTKSRACRGTKWDFNFFMEGSLFWDGYNYQAYLQYYLKLLGVEEMIVFSQNRHHSIQGGIKLLTGLS